MQFPELPKNLRDHPGTEAAFRYAKIRPFNFEFRHEDAFEIRTYVPLPRSLKPRVEGIRRILVESAEMAGVLWRDGIVSQAGVPTIAGRRVKVKEMKVSGSILETLSFKLDLDQERAKQVLPAYLARIERVEELAKAGEFLHAQEEMRNPHFLEGTSFSLDPATKERVIELDDLSNEARFETAYRPVAASMHAGFHSAFGDPVVVAPRIQVRLQDGSLTSLEALAETGHPVAKKAAWIHFLGCVEEYLHVAQAIKEVTGDWCYLSRLMSKPDFHSHQSSPEGIAKVLNYLSVHVPRHRIDDAYEPFEADIYARWIERFGRDQIPVRMGARNHPVRLLVDEAYPVSADSGR